MRKNSFQGVKICINFTFFSVRLTGDVEEATPSTILSRAAISFLRFCVYNHGRHSARVGGKNVFVERKKNEELKLLRKFTI